MKTSFETFRPEPRPQGGFTLVETLIAVGLSSLVLAMVATLSLYGTRTFASLGNYADLDAKSRYALDVVSRELRQATAVVAVQTNLPRRSLTLTNADLGQTLKLVWDSNAQMLVLQKTGQSNLVALVQCDDWNFTLYNRSPTFSPTNIVFNPTASLTDCKLISMSWKCSRQLLRQKVHTESVQTAQIVLRNKIN